MPTLKESLWQQFEDAISQYTLLARNSFRQELVSQFAYSALAAIERATGADSIRSQQARKEVELLAKYNAGHYIAERSIRVLAGMACAVRDQVEAGYLDDVKALIHGDMFSNLLEQAEYLLSEGYKDPAAVLGGGVLEEHLRNLCDKNGIPYTLPDGKPKQASVMNVDLTKEKMYTVNQQKEVTAWLGVRNSAAHGKFTEYDANHVKHMLAGIRSFINRYPA